MKLVLWTIKFLSLSIILSSCGSSDLEEVTGGGSVSSTFSESVAYLDRSGSMSSDGSKVLFVSYRDSSVPKIYSYDSSLDVATQPQRLTSEDSEYGQEVLAKVSPDGSMVAFISKDESDQYHLYVQTWEGSIVGEVTGPTGIIRFDELEFSSDSIGLSYVATVEQDDVTTVSSTYVKISLSSSFSFDQVTTAAGEWQARVVVDGASKYMVTRTISESLQTIFKTYQIDESGSPALTLVKTSSGLSSVGDKFINISESGVYFARTLEEPRVKEILGDVDPQEDGSSAKGYVRILNGLSSVDLLDSSSAVSFSSSDLGTFPNYEPTDVYGIQVVDTDLLAIYGGDYYVCNNGTVYLTSIVFYNTSTKVSVPVTIGTTEGLPSTAVVDTCSNLVANTAASDQPIESKITSVNITGTLAGGFKVLIQSWDSGDGEIYQVNFKMGTMDASDESLLTDSNVSEVEVLQISNFRTID